MTLANKRLERAGTRPRADVRPFSAGRSENRGLYAPTYEGVVLPLDAGSRISGRFRFGRVTLGLVALWLSGASIMAISAMAAIVQAVAMPRLLVVVVIAAGLITI